MGGKVDGAVGGGKKGVMGDLWGTCSSTAFAFHGVGGVVS